VATFEPIGYIQCDQRYRYEAPRQGVLRPNNQATIELLEGSRYAEALAGLDGFERIWVIFELHLNENWHPLVQPPHEDAPKRGVFATRSPHRPNRIGMSCVRLLGIDGRRLRIAGHDLLDATPVLDLKPYVPYADAFPEAATGWLEDVSVQRQTVIFEDTAAEQSDWIRQHAGLDCENFAHVQLTQDPADNRRKRIAPGATPGTYVISYRTWRLDYVLAPAQCTVRITGIRSGFSPEDLTLGSTDRYGDKDAHRAFIERFCAISKPLSER
jgi:tRNA (adenine37-N6)-methyltransferase